jgi:hypothetical protein
MPYANDAVDDMEKLKVAFSEVASKFGSFDSMLEAFGLTNMPPAQRYGILFGCIVFTLTITAVIGLLTFGGTFARIAEQEESGNAAPLTPVDARSRRQLLLEQLLDGRERMKQQYPPEPTVDQVTPLTKMLLNVAPDAMTDELAELLEDHNIGNKENKKKSKGKKKKEIKRYIPPYYEENYVSAYRKCQDRPGGTYRECRMVGRGEDVPLLEVVLTTWNLHTHRNDSFGTPGSSL